LLLSGRWRLWRKHSLSSFLALSRRLNVFLSFDAAAIVVVSQPTFSAASFDGATFAPFFPLDALEV
jgi:hypothetical protein